jgi:hypothetical protein
LDSRAETSRFQRGLFFQGTIQGTSGVAAVAGFRITQVLFSLGLSIYFGGLLILGLLVAPEIFNTLSAAGVHATTINPQLDQSKELAGAIFGNILAVFAIVQIGCLFLMLFSVLFQMAFHLNVIDIWVWLRLGAVLILAMLLGGQMLRIDPAVRREHQLWVRDVNAGSAQAATHEAAFKRDHAAAERNGGFQMAVLLMLVLIQGWGIYYPSGREFVRTLAERAKLIEPSAEPPK